MKNWYVVHTKPRREKLGQSSLQWPRIGNFFPKIKQPQRFHKKEKIVFRPVFSGYFFVQFDLQRYDRAVVFARGVKS